MGSYLEHTFQSLSISVSVSVSPSPLTYTRFRFQGTMRAPVTLPPSREPRGAGKKVTTHLALGHGLRAAPSSLLFVLTCFTHCPFSYLCTHSPYSPLGAEENDCYQVHFSSPFFSIFFFLPYHHPVQPNHNSSVEESQNVLRCHSNAHQQGFFGILGL